MEIRSIENFNFSLFITKGEVVFFYHWLIDEVGVRYLCGQLISTIFFLNTDKQAIPNPCNWSDQQHLHIICQCKKTWWTWEIDLLKVFKSTPWIFEDQHLLLHLKRTEDELCIFWDGYITTAAGKRECGKSIHRKYFRVDEGLREEDKNDDVDHLIFLL